VNILDKPALINVGRSEKGREKVVSVVAIPKGTTVPTRFNPLQTFFIDEWDDAVFAQIPEGIQKIIKQSDEYKALKNGDRSEPDPDDNLGPNSDEDRPPF